VGLSELHATISAHPEGGKHDQKFTPWTIPHAELVIFTLRVGQHNDALMITSHFPSSQSTFRWRLEAAFVPYIAVGSRLSSSGWLATRRFSRLCLETSNPEVRVEKPLPGADPRWRPFLDYFQIADKSGADSDALCSLFKLTSLSQQTFYRRMASRTPGACYGISLRRVS
jgi:hypothetical protein